MRFRLHSPTQSLFDGEARLVVAHSPEGEFAVMDGHEPLLAVVAPGPLRIETSEGTRVFAVRGGILQVTREDVTCLAHEAVAAEALDPVVLGQEREALDRRIGNKEPSPELQQERAWLAAKEKVGHAHG